MEESKKRKRFAGGEELANKLKAIKAKKMYPYSYAKKVQKIYNESLQEGEKPITADKVHQVAGAFSYDERIVDILLKLALNNKIKSQNELADDILS